MYQLIGSLCLGNTIGAQWETPDLTNVLMYSVFNNYKKFYLTLSHPSTPDLLYVDMNVLRTSVSGYSGSVSEWLVSIDNQALPTIPSLPNSLVRYAKYANAIQAGYLIDLGVAGLNYPENYPITSRVDLKITREQFSTQMKLIDTHCLLTINGFFHDCVASDTEAFALNGAVTAKLGNDNHVGIYSFLDIGSLTRKKINPVDIVPMELNSTLMEKVRFTINADLTGKSYFLILGGYLVLPEEDVFFQTGENTFSLNLNKIPYEERILESLNFLDLTSLELVNVDDSPSAVSIQNITSDAVIKKYMTLSQSFLVIVDCENLMIDKKVIKRAAFPGQFLSAEDPVYPLIGGHGKLFEYWKQQENNKWALNCRDTFYKRFVYTEGPRTRALYGSPALDTTRTFEHTYGFLLEISSLKQIV